MNSFDYSRPAATALRLLARYGQEVEWQKPAPAVAGSDPWRDDRGDVPPTIFRPMMAFFSPLDLSRGRGQFAMFAKGTDIVDYTEVGLLAGACGFVPEVTDVLIRGGSITDIVEIDKIAPAGTPLLYFVAVK